MHCSMHATFLLRPFHFKPHPSSLPSLHLNPTCRLTLHPSASSLVGRFPSSPRVSRPEEARLHLEPAEPNLLPPGGGLTFAVSATLTLFALSQADLPFSQLV